MEAYEATRIVYSRVQALDPDNVSKIMGYLLLEEQGERQIFGLARGPDSLLQAAAARARMQLGLAVDSPPSPQQQQQQQPVAMIPSLRQTSSFSGGVFPNDQFYPETFAFLNSSKIKAETSGGGWPLEPDTTTRATSCSCSNSTATATWKTSPSFFSRGGAGGGAVSHYGATDSPSGAHSDHDGAVEQTTAGEQVIDLSLERLERELQELLSGRSSPVSIAALPQLYYERFGKPLQAEGYLTESQRHGKSGYNLTRLLTKLKASITLIDRPHGQHAVVLAEDAHKFATFAAGEQCDLSGVNPSSRQIYLTFPAESSFSEDDVSTHFRAYGPVQDVRIPYQQKRMFGFVTFVYPETVKIVLSEGNPHYICGARVLVKPYRERGKHGDSRKHLDASKYVDVANKDSGHALADVHDAGSRFQSEDNSALAGISSRKGISVLDLPQSHKQSVYNQIP